MPRGLRPRLLGGRVRAHRTERRSVLAPILFLAPAALMFSGYVIWPLVSSVWISLYDWDGIGPSRWVGVGNFRELLLEDEDFATALGNNIRWLVLYLVAPPAGLALALALNRGLFGIRLLRSLFFFPFVISPVVVGLVFSWFYDPYYGLLNRVLGLVGLGPFAANAQLAGIGGDRAAEQLNEGRFAGAVLTQQSPHLARRKREVEVAERHHPRIGFGQAAGFEDRSAGARLRRAGVTCGAGEHARLWGAGRGYCPLCSSMYLLIAALSPRTNSCTGTTTLKVAGTLPCH